VSASADRKGRGGPGGPPGDVELPTAPVSLTRIPASNSAERAVLGAILADGNCFYRVVDIVDGADFYNEAHRVVFHAFGALAHDNRDIDLVTAADQLERSGTLDAAGGVAYLSGLADELPDPANVEHYAAIVRERSVKRELLKISQELMAACARDEGSAMDALDGAEAQILGIAERAMRGSLKKIGPLVKEEVRFIEEVAKTRAPFTGIETGFRRLDELTSGLQRQDLIILAARPGVGKTAMALNIAANAAVRLQRQVAFFSLEMASQAVVRRMIAAEARINIRRLTRGLLSKTVDPADPRQEASDWQRLAEAADRLADATLWLDDAPALSILELRGKCRRLQMEHGLDLVVVDYLQLMSAGVRAENRTQEVSAITRGLKAIAKQLNVPLIALSQLSRQPERRGADSRPQLSDLRESGSIEQDADVVIFINRKNRALLGPDATEEEEDLRLAEIIIAKQRNGPTDLFKLVYFDEYTRFDDPEFSYGR
jgi:replicative DNA helicase